MCFSATASFTAGSTLTLVGLLSVSYAQSLKQRMIAAIPLCFGLQQMAEGIVWRGMENNNSDLIAYGAYGFLFFAFFFWPIWVPLSMYTIEPNPKRRIALRALTAVGIGLGCYLLYHILNTGILVKMFECHIQYDPKISSALILPGMIIYLIVTVVPFFIVLNPFVNLMGAALAASYLLTHLFYTEVLISVWCFFAAIISFFAIWVIQRMRSNK